MIDDLDLLTLSLLFFGWLFLLALGHAVNRMYLILSFFVGTFLTIKVFSLVPGDDGLILAVVFIAMTFTIPWFLGDD